MGAWICSDREEEESAGRELGLKKNRSGNPLDKAVSTPSSETGPRQKKGVRKIIQKAFPGLGFFFFLAKQIACLSPGGESGAGGWGKHFGTIPVRVLTDRPLPFPCPTRLGEESAPQVYLNRALLSDWATGKREKMQRMKSEGSSGSQIRLSLFLHGLWGDWSRGRQHNKIWNRCSTSGESSGYTSSSLPTASKAAWVEVLRHSPADETSAHSRASRKGRLKSAPTQITTRGSA